MKHQQKLDKAALHPCLTLCSQQENTRKTKGMSTKVFQRDSAFWSVNPQRTLFWLETEQKGSGEVAVKSPQQDLDLR